MDTLVGIRPTGRLHLGHYFSVIKPALEKKAKVLIASYHAPLLNPNIEANTYKALTRFDINPNDIKRQQIGFNAKLYFDLLALTKIGELKRMTQFKSSNYPTAHLFVYPVLMAHDVYGWDRVIVGEDQRQHLEFCRKLLKRYNKMELSYEQEIPVGDYRGGKIMSLSDPTKKMSKSNPKGCLFLDDSSGVMGEKIRKAVTTPVGVENLKVLYSEFISNYCPLEYNTLKNNLHAALVKRFHE